MSRFDEFGRPRPAFDRGLPDWAQRIPQQGGERAPEPKPLDWKQWGASIGASVTFNLGGEVIAVPVPQVVNIEFDRPMSWQLAWHVSLASGDASAPDSALYQATLTAGLGMSRFPGVFPAIAALGPGALGPYIVPGPILPAQTIIVDGTVIVTANGGGVFPRTTHVTLGAFLAPITW